MAQTGAQRVQKHRENQRKRIAELEEVLDLQTRAASEAREPEIPTPTPSKKRRTAAYWNVEHGSYGPTTLANNNDEPFSFDSFLAGVGTAIAMFEKGKKWYLHDRAIEKAMRLLLANVNDTGEISQVHAGMHLAATSHLKAWRGR